MNDIPLFKKVIVLSFCLFVAPNFIAFFIGLFSGKLFGDYIYVGSLDSIFLLSSLLISQVPVLVIYFFCAIFFVKQKNINNLDFGSFSKVLLLYQFVYLYFVIFYDVGVVGGKGSTFAFLFSLVPLKVMLFFYVLSELIKHKQCPASIRLSPFLFLNLLIYALIQLMQGWTFFALSYIVIYLFYVKWTSLRIISFLFFAFLFLYFVYPYVDAYKYFVRYGYFEVNELSIIDVLGKLVGRLSQISNIYYFLEHFPRAESLYASRLVDMDYIRDYIIAVIPKKLVGVTDFTTFNQLGSTLIAETEITNSSISIPLLLRFLVYFFIMPLNALTFLFFYLFAMSISFVFLVRKFKFVGFSYGMMFFLSTINSTNMLMLSYDLYSFFFIFVIMSLSKVRLFK